MNLWPSAGYVRARLHREPRLSVRWRRSGTEREYPTGRRKEKRIEGQQEGERRRRKGRGHDGSLGLPERSALSRSPPGLKSITRTSCRAHDLLIAVKTLVSTKLSPLCRHQICSSPGSIIYRDNLAPNTPVDLGKINNLKKSKISSRRQFLTGTFFANQCA